MNKSINTSSLPSSFRYRTVYEKGKPVHDPSDSFSIRHPPMELSRRAKIFAPFDALKGFREAIGSKETDIITTPEDPAADDENL